jgi:uncharacterized HAD superfamily protein
MNFGFDIDGVLYPWHMLVWKWYVDKTGENISMVDFWKYPNGHVANNEGSPWVTEMVKNPLPYIAQPVHAGVLRAVKYIANHYADTIYYITGRPLHVRNATRDWLKHNRLPFAENLIFADEYELDGVKGKEAAVIGTDCSYYVEDRPKYLETIPMFATTFIMNTPYNQYREFDGCYRIDDLDEIPVFLDQFGELKR